MEWEVYYEDYLLFKKMSTCEGITYQAAAIIGQDGKVWAQSSNFPQVKAEERNAILREFDEPGTLTMTGLYLGGTNYVVIGVEPGDVIRASKCREAVTIKKTNAALVIGRYNRSDHGEGGRGLNQAGLLGNVTIASFLPLRNLCIVLMQVSR